MSDRITEEWQAFQRPEDEGSNYWRIRMQDGLDSLHGYCGEDRAYLAAAAPDLLAALKAALAYPITGNWWEQACAAIAKAERRPAK